MFNSVAQYLWGGAEEVTDGTNDLQTTLAVSQQAPGCPDPAKGDCQNSSLSEAVECDHDEDWVIVGDADKENCSLSSVASHHHLPNNHHYHSNNHQSHHSSDDSLSQQLNEAELLDEAASLNHATLEHKSLSDQEDNDIDSGRRPSSPESVFSVCSGRSSATYKPRGMDSEVWIVAPPPCFTGSQCGSLSPLVSSPIENLLIEHPSMSVYVSQPFHNNSPSSQDHFSNPQGMSSIAVSESTADDALLSADSDANIIVEESHSRVTDQGLSLAPRHQQSREAVNHHHPMSKEALCKSQDRAQRKVISVAQRAISKQKCRRQNQVQAISSSSKAAISKQNKQIRPSGFRCSRVPQRQNVSAKHV